jgi:4-amino-4-deoxy-L-arabinose transferase-like glycosyltransferase
MCLMRGSGWVRTLFCAVVAALLYLPALGRPALWEPDEGRYAEIAREMVISGDWITPRDNFVRYFEKPPLVYWMTALSLEAFGQNEFSARLPAAVFSIGLVALVQWLGEAMFGAGVGLASAMCLGLSPIFFGFARFSTLDPALAFFVTAALALFRRAALAEPPGSRRARSQLIGAAGCAALGTLAKGPVAIVIVAMVATVYLIVEPRARRQLACNAWMACAALYFAMVVPWFALVSIRNPGFLGFFFLHEHLQRYLSSGEHGWGPWFFLGVVAAGTWPWIFFAPWVKGRAWQGDANAGPASAIRFLLIWFAVVLVFFSIPRSKLGSYILPGLPPLAILCGLGIGRLSALDLRRRSRCFGFLAASNLTLAGAASIALVITVGQHAALRAAATDLIVAASVLGIGSTVAFMLSQYSRTITHAVGVLGLGVVVALFTGTRAREDVATLGSYRTLAGVVKPCVQAGCTLASYHHFVQALPFYTGSREALVAYRGELAPFGDSPDASASFIESDRKLAELWRNRCIVLIANRRDLAYLQTMLAPPLQAIGAEGKKLALTNRLACLP